MHFAGYNVYGQLGLRDRLDRSRFTPIPALRGRGIVALACGDHHSAAVSRSGEVWLWGRGDCGQLGQGDDCRHVLLGNRLFCD